jgi:hypothetical protein
MDANEKEILITVLKRLRALEQQQRDDAISLLAMLHAFSSNPDNQKKLDMWKQSATQTISQRRGASQDQLYDELIGRLKASSG